MRDIPISDFTEIEEEIQIIVNSLPPEKREKVIKWINEKLGELYDAWQSMMGEDL